MTPVVAIANTVVNKDVFSKARDTSGLRAFEGILLFSIVLVSCQLYIDSYFRKWYP